MKVSKTAFVLDVVLIAFSVSCSRNDAAPQTSAPPPVAVRAVAARAVDVPLEVAAIGNVEAVSTVDVKPRLTGPILKVLFQEGQDVSEGTLLFELDSQPLLRQITELEANLARDTANEKQARANIAKDHATLKNAQSIAARGLQLAKEGIFSREQTEQVVSAADSAKASLDADQAAVESAQAAMKADSARVAETRLQLTYTKIYAPISGRTGAIPVKEGNVAKENDTTLVTLLQVNPVYVSFSIPENLLAEVRRHNVGHPLAVSAVTADGSTVTGSLHFIDSSVDTTTGTIKLKASFDNAARKLWPGQFVNVRAQLMIEHDRISIPSRTVQTGPRGKYVWVMNHDTTVSMRVVNILRNYTTPETGEQAIVGAGLRPGEMVISEGQMRLIPGAHVRLLPSNAPSPADTAGSAS